MRICECARDVLEDSDRFDDGKSGAALESRAQRQPIDEGHRVIRKSSCNSGSEDGNDVRMLELPRQLDLSLEPLDAYSSCELRGEHLDGDFASERDFFADEHAAHSPSAQLPLDCIGGCERLPEIVE